MAHYLIAHLNGGRYKDISVLSPEGMAELHRVSGVRPLGFHDNKSYAGYAMGWFAGEMAGVPVLHHGGSTANFVTHVVIQPEQRQGLVVLTNAFASNRLADGVLSLLSGRPAPKVESRRPLGVDWLVVPLIQLVAFVLSLIALRRWRRRPENRPRKMWGKTWRIGLPLLLDIAIAGWVAKQFAGIDLPFEVSLLYFPGLLILLLTCAAFAIVWGLIRTTWSVQILRSAT